MNNKGHTKPEEQAYDVISEVDGKQAADSSYEKLKRKNDKTKEAVGTSTLTHVWRCVVVVIGLAILAALIGVLFMVISSKYDFLHGFSL